MALIKCKECGKEISSDAVSCPHCGKPQFSATTNTSKKMTGWQMVALVVVGTIVVTIIGINLSSTPAPTPVPVAASAGPTEEAEEDDPPIPPLQAYSGYVGDIQSSLFVTAVALQVSLDQLKKDFAFANQEGMKKDLDSLRIDAESQSRDIASANADTPLSEADAPYFDRVAAAAQDLASDSTDLVLNLAAGANYGSIDTPDVERLVRSAHLKRKKFEVAVYDGYKHFGRKRSDIDAGTLQLKDTNVVPSAAEPAEKTTP
jgi:zinc ribbon protein